METFVSAFGPYNEGPIRICQQPNAPCLERDSMILECPACHARFLIADAALGTAGRNVRCGRCKNQWHQDPLVGTTAIGPLPEPAASATGGTPHDFLSHLAQSEASDPALSGIVYDERLVPAIRPRQPAPVWMRVAASLTVAASLLLGIVANASWIAAHLPASHSVLHAMGVLPSNGLVLADVAFAQKEDGAGVRTAIGCAVRNTGTQMQRLPDLRLRMVGKSGATVLDAHGLLAPIERIAPGDEVPCDIPAAVLHTGSARQIVLDLGSPLELQTRH